MNWSTKDLADHYKRAGVPNPIAEACGSGASRSKFGVDQSAQGKADRTADGVVFASKDEMHDYVSLKIAEKAGFISNLELQPRYLLQEKFTDASGKKHRAMFYVADFRFQRDGKTIIAERKGFETPAWRIKQKLFAKMYPNETLEVWK